MEGRISVRRLLWLIRQRLACFAWFAVKRSFPKPGRKLFVAFVTFCKPLCLDSKTGEHKLILSILLILSELCLDSEAGNSDPQEPTEITETEN